MDAQAAARAVLKNIGGKGNVVQNDLCMTRLRLRVANPTLIDRDALINTTGVLGVVTFGSNGLEVVFGPRSGRSRAWSPPWSCRPWEDAPQAASTCTSRTPSRAKPASRSSRAPSTTRPR